MNKELQVKGTQKFMEMEIPVIEGGFGEGQKVMLAKTIAEIHGQRMDKINALINDNIDEFEIGVDLLDLKGNENFANLCKVNGFYTQNALNSSKNIYLLSEQGYVLLIGFMRTDKAKEIRKQLRREYFTMREIVNSLEQQKAQLLLSIYNGGQEGVLASKQLTEIEVKEATKPLLQTIEKQKPIMNFADTVIKKADNILIREMAKLLSDEGFVIGEKNLYKKLREWGWILSGRTEPSQKAMELGIFVVDEKDIKDVYANTRIVRTTKVTGKGQVFIVEKFRKEKEKKENNL